MFKMKTRPKPVAPVEPIQSVEEVEEEDEGYDEEEANPITAPVKQQVQKKKEEATEEQPITKEELADMALGHLQRVAQLINYLR